MVAELVILLGITSSAWTAACHKLRATIVLYLGQQRELRRGGGSHALCSGLHLRRGARPFLGIC
eukprot:2542544-Amphidinium_carterae.3